MLDENLPIFFLAPSTDGVKHHESILLSRGGQDPSPAYSLRHADPSQPSSKNCYAVALFDAYNPDVLFGEVLIRPKWTQASLSAEEIRRNGGVAPPPEPIMPTEFSVQLYNPELQIAVSKGSGLLGSTHYDFSMPQDTFRMPSGSMLDRVQDDPGANQTTPRINFSLKRESKLSKDMVLLVKGKSTDVFHKKKSKEPDIAIAIFKSLREVTILESNLYRVEMEDAKGLEVVILLLTAVIRDVFHGSLQQAFNVSGGGRRRSSGAKTTSNGPAVSGQYSMSGAAGPGGPAAPGPGPITDPRTQWELDQETRRLKQQAADEARQQQRMGQLRKAEREKADAEEAQRIQKMLQDEEEERRRRQAEVDAETARLQQLYGVQTLPEQSSMRPQTQSAPVAQGPFPQPPPPQNSNLATYPQYPQASTQRPQSASFQQPPQQSYLNQQQQQYPGYNPQQYNPPQPQQPALPPRPQQQQYGGGGGGGYPSSSGGGLGAMSAGASLGQLFHSGDRRKQKSNWNLKSGSGKLQKKSSSVF